MISLNLVRGIFKAIIDYILFMHFYVQGFMHFREVNTCRQNVSGSFMSIPLVLYIISDPLVSRPAHS